MLSRIKWESIDDFRPPNGSLKHVPKSEHAALFRARAQKDDNAVALLGKGKTKLKALTQRGKDARRHELAMMMPSIPSVNPRKTPSSRSLSAIEKLPLELRFKVVSRLDINDRVCLALTSTTMMRTTLHATDSNTLEYQAQQEEYSWCEHEDLIRQLQDWMPPYLAYCFHCLTYIPRSSFGPDIDEIDYLVCMDCRFYTHKGLEPIPLSGDFDRVCDGCYSLDAKIDGFLDVNPEFDPEYLWARLNGLVFNDPESSLSSDESETGDESEKGDESEPGD